LPLLRVVQTQSETVVIVCDEELVGKTFRKKGMKLEVKESFYKGKETSVDECLCAIENATIANLVGSIVKHAVKAGMINGENVLSFQRVLHAQMVKM
jgi:hypothetical protein